MLIYLSFSLHHPSTFIFACLNYRKWNDSGFCLLLCTSNWWYSWFLFAHCFVKGSFSILVCDHFTVVCSWLCCCQQSCWWCSTWPSIFRPPFVLLLTLVVGLVNGIIHISPASGTLATNFLSNLEGPGSSNQLCNNLLSWETGVTLAAIFRKRAVATDCSHYYFICFGYW